MKQNDFTVSLRKTTIIEVNEQVHALPPDGGPFREYKVADYFCPDEWSKDGIFVEVQEGQPLWFDFRGNDECACLVSVQRLNPLTGEPIDLEKGLAKDPKQNYVKIPEQKWLDGYSKDGKVYQFIVTKAGEGLAVNEYILPVYLQDSHAIAFAFFGPKNPKPKYQQVLRSYDMPYVDKLYETSPMWFSPLYSPQNWQTATRGKGMSSSIPGATFCSTGGKEVKTCGGVNIAGGEAVVECFAMNYSGVLGTPEEIRLDDSFDSDALECSKASMGMGGRIQQDILTDDNTVEYYHDKPDGILTVYLALPEQFKKITSKGKRQDARKPDKHVFSGDIGGIPVPLITKSDITAKA